jgi:hypothetical protein
MLLLVVLLAQAVVPPPDELPGRWSPGVVDVAALIERWESLREDCRRLPVESGEGISACAGRDVVRVQLGRLGWCLTVAGVRIEWDMCPHR